MCLLAVGRFGSDIDDAVHIHRDLCRQHGVLNKVDLYAYVEIAVAEMQNSRTFVYRVGDDGRLCIFVNSLSKLLSSTLC